MKVDVLELKKRIEKSNKVTPVKVFKAPLLSKDDIKELRREAKKIKEAYIKSWRRARDVYVR